MNLKTLKKYHQLNVTLDSGVTFMIKTKGEHLEEVCQWLDGTTGIDEYDEVAATSPMKPHVTEKMKDKQTKITAARMKAGLTQQEFADLLGASRIQAQRWEYGKVRLRISTLKRIAKALNVEWTDLMEEPNVITLAREKAGITQEAFARALGVGTTQAQRWERDYKQLPVDKLQQIAEILGIDVSELVGE